MGMCNAPAHFQWVMEDVLAGLPVAILLDDVTIAEADLQESIDGAVDAIIRLCQAGAMVGLYKGVIGAEEAEFMGEQWTSGGYFCPNLGKVTALLREGDEYLASMSRA